MRELLKASLFFLCMAVGTYAIAGTGTQQAPIQPINTVALAKKASTNTEIVLSGKLLLEKNKFILEDSTGTIVLAFSKEPEIPIKSLIGQNVTVTGLISKTFWAKLKITSPLLKVTKIELVTPPSK